MIELMRFLSAVVLTYAFSRALWRLPLASTAAARLVRAHGGSALVLGGLFAALALAIAPAVTVVVAQGGWFLFDLARGRAEPRRATRPARR